MSFRGIFRSLRIFSLAIYLLITSRRISRLERRVKAGIPDAQPKLDRLFGKMGVRVRLTALHLQGLMVKVGQFLSTRTDILPTSFTRELKSLQDAVPGVDFEQIKSVIESELGSSLQSNFSSFDTEPLAAASLGQVHLATLAQGGQVAVKILRPGIERLADVDLRALRTVTSVMQRFTRIGRRVRAVEIYREFAATVRQELDYRQEAEHLLRFSRQFRNRNDIVVPRLFPAYNTRRVLVMEYIEGIKVNDLSSLGQAHIDANHIVDLVIDTYLDQILEHGFIHVDPHPGNLLVLSDGRLCYLDFGMMSDIPRRESVLFARLLLAAMVREVDTVVQCIEDLGFLQPYADKVFLKRALRFMIDRVNGVELKRGRELDEFLEEFQAFLRDEPLILQAKYMFLGRALGMVLGLVNSLNPNIAWAPLLKERALPKLRKLVSEATASSEAGMGGRFLNQLSGFVESLFGETAATATRVALSQLQSAALASVRLPQQMESVLERVNRSELEVRLELSEVFELLHHRDKRVARLISFAALAVLIPLGFYFRTVHHVYLTWEAWGLALVAAIRWLWTLRRTSYDEYGSKGRKGSLSSRHTRRRLRGHRRNRPGNGQGSPSAYSQGDRMPPPRGNLSENSSGDRPGGEPATHPEQRRESVRANDTD